MGKTAKEIIRIAIVGPECTGKSTLSEQLAQHYKTKFVPEFAREYIGKLQRPYTIEDIVTIAKEQIRTEDETTLQVTNLLICDTNLIVTKIWAEFKYHTCPSWITENIRKRKYDLHLLTNTDIPWQADPQREHPNQREELFELYKKELQAEKVLFKIISGKPEERLKQAIEAIDSLKN